MQGKYPLPFSVVMSRFMPMPEKQQTADLKRFLVRENTGMMRNQSRKWWFRFDDLLYKIHF